VLPVQGERRILRALVACAVVCVAFAGGAGPAGARAPKPAAPKPKPATFFVGAAKADVTPTDLTDFYLGGYGIGPVHEATAVLRHIYFRVIAIRDRRGNQAVIGVIDSQGYSVVWGGVPDTYFAFVTRQMESAITTAVQREQPANLHVGTADMTGFSGTFGSNTDATDTGDNADYPIDQQLRVLQAVAPHGSHVIATLVNYSTHPTVYGPLNQISPDWPGATATYLEGDEQNTQPGAKYGYPGSVAIVTVGAVGHSWPARVPAGDTDPAVDPTSAATDDNYPADMYGNAVARQAIGAVAGGRGFWETESTVGGTERKVHVENTNPVLLVAGAEPANSSPLGGYKIDRAITPPWGAGDVFISPVTTLRIGNLPFYGVPGEPYPSIKFSLGQNVSAPVSFIFGLAQDQLGYVEELSDYNGALQCSTSDEWFFTISPVFGSDVERLSQSNAQALGFQVKPHSAVSAYRPGTVPPSLNCSEQELEHPGLPAG
jgi:hypothetical protein